MPLTDSTVTRAITARLTLDQDRRLRAAAERNGCTVSDQIRRLADQLPPPPAEAPARRRRPNASAYHPG